MRKPRNKAHARTRRRVTSVAATTARCGAEHVHAVHIGGQTTARVGKLEQPLSLSFGASLYCRDRERAGKREQRAASLFSPPSAVGTSDPATRESQMSRRDGRRARDRATGTAARSCSTWKPPRMIRHRPPRPPARSSPHTDSCERDPLRPLHRARARLAHGAAATAVELIKEPRTEEQRVSWSGPLGRGHMHVRGAQRKSPEPHKKTGPLISQRQTLSGRRASEAATGHGERNK